MAVGRLLHAHACTRLAVQLREAKTATHLEVHGAGHRKGSLMDGDLLLFTHAEDDRVDLLVLTHDPDYETRHVQVVDELPPGHTIPQSNIMAIEVSYLHEAGHDAQGATDSHFHCRSHTDKQVRQLPHLGESGKLHAMQTDTPGQLYRKCGQS